MCLWPNPMKAEYSSIEVPKDATEEEIAEALKKDARSKGMKIPDSHLEDIAKQVAGHVTDMKLAESAPKGQLIHDGTGTIQW